MNPGRKLMILRVFDAYEKYMFYISHCSLTVFLLIENCKNGKTCISYNSKLCQKRSKSTVGKRTQVKPVSDCNVVNPLLIGF